MEIITLAAGLVGLVILAVMALAPLVADLPLPRPVRPAAAGTVGAAERPFGAAREPRRAA